MIPNIVVIGIGNDLRGDDAIGLLAARAVAELHPPGVIVCESRGDGARLLDLWEAADTVFLIDAVHAGALPGTLHRIDVSFHPLPSTISCGSSHEFGLAQAVETARALGILPRRIILFGVEVGRCDAGTSGDLPAAVLQGLVRALRAELTAADRSQMAEHH